MRRRLVDREAGRGRRQLEQDAARLAKVDRLEVVAVAHVCDVGAGLAQALLPGEVILVAAVPGDVVDASGAEPAGLAARVLVAPAHLAAATAQDVRAAAVPVEDAHG